MNTKYPKDFLERMEVYTILKERNRENLKNRDSIEKFNFEPEIHEINPKVQKIFD